MIPSSMPAAPDAFQAVVLAGGRARRLGGIDKTALTRHGRTLLRESVEATAGARSVVVVGAGNREGGLSGSHLLLGGRATFIDERPAHGGPVPGLAAGLRAARAAPGADAFGAPTWTLLLAADLPRAVAACRRLLARRRPEHTAVIATDSGGRPQPLLALYRTGPLTEAVGRVADSHGLVGARLQDVLQAMDADRVQLIELADELCADVDTWADAAAAGYAPPHPVLAGGDGHAR